MVRFCLLLSLVVSQLSAAEDIAFAGRDPGVATAEVNSGALRLGNGALAAEWRIEGGVLRPVSVTQKLAGLEVNQSAAEVFRLTTITRPAPAPGIDITLSLTADRVIVTASKDGYAAAEVASFPRSDFPGEPRLVRLGKMNLLAQARDHSGEAGVLGRSSVGLVAPRLTGRLAEPFRIEAAANRTAVVEGAYPTGVRQLTARIDKGDDKGMTWGPAVALVWEDGKRFLLVGVRDANGTLNITTAQGERAVSPRLTEFPLGDIPASAFKVQGAPRVAVLTPATGKVSRPADAIRGLALEVDLVHASGLRALWRAELRDGANHFRQTLEISSGSNASLPLRGVELTDLRQPGLRVIGSVPGCPSAGEGFFAGLEMPGSGSRVDAEGVRQAVACDLQVSSASRIRFGSVLGVYADGQLRRGFLRYMERERARASRPFLHYNCWYDLGYGVDQPKMIEVVKAFEAELVRKRGVPVLSYLVDDGWDDFGKGLWVDNLKRFPQGLPGLGKAMGALGGRLSIWISPLGGYGGVKERTEWARKMGLIPAGAELDLSYPKYREWFEGRCLQLMRESGVNAFKWDKAGEGVGPHFMALLDVARRLRQENPDLFVNVTVGTWPSPFWLNHVDTTWRNDSSDVGWIGKGDDREKWLTFRDGYCRKMFVERSPLYPLNSAMHHGIVHGRQFQGVKVGKAGTDLRNEARSYFANGAMLQELYLTPSMMTSAGWDAVAESAKWAHARADVLRDAHWVGGDPLKLEPYGYAAWSPRMATLMVRNPDDQRREIDLEASQVFDLPATSPGTYDLASPYADQRLKTLVLTKGSPVKVTLEPFEVLVFDAIPRK